MWNLHLKLRRTANVQKSTTMTIEALSDTSGSRLRGSSPSNIVEFGVWLCTLKVSTKAEVLDFRRASFSLLRAQLKGKLPWRIKELATALSF